MEYSYMKARKGDVFERRFRVRHERQMSKRYVVVDYTASGVIAVCLDKPKIWRGKVRVKIFPYDELNQENFGLLDIR